MDCEIFSIIQKMMQGIVVNDETLALETIANVGPGGHYLAQKHTRKHMRELFMPAFMDRRPYSEWEDEKRRCPRLGSEQGPQDPDGTPA